MRTLFRIAAAYVAASFVAWLIFPLPFEAHGVQRATILISLVFPVITLSALFTEGLTVKMWSFLGVFVLLFLPLIWVSLKGRAEDGLGHRPSLKKPGRSK